MTLSGGIRKKDPVAGSFLFKGKRKTAQSDFPLHLVLFGYILRIHSHKSIITLSGSSFAAAR